MTSGLPGAAIVSLIPRRSIAVAWNLLSKSRTNSSARAWRSMAQPPEEREWIQVAFYHWVLDDQREVFRRQLESLRKYGDFISLDDAVELLRSGNRIGGRYFAITFDDGFKNCLANAVPV